MDNFHPQSTNLHLKEGHEGTDLSIRGVVLFGIGLVLAGSFAFVAVLGLYWALQTYQRNHEPKPTPVEQQLLKERETEARTGMRTPLPAAATNEVKPVPDWYGRGKMEEHLARTFPGPRLQYDDVYDMNLFRKSEEQWLSSTGKNPDGSVHIPVARAMDLLVQRGLPQVSGPFVPPMLPTAVPMVPAGPSRR